MSSDALRGALCQAFTEKVHYKITAIIGQEEGLGVESLQGASLIAAAKREYETACDALLAAGTPETFDCCSIAYFHAILTGDGSVDSGASPQENVTVPLFEAIRRKKSGIVMSICATPSPLA